MTNYEKWCQEKLLPPYTAEKYLDWLQARAFGYGDVEELEFGMYNILFPSFCEEVLDAITAKLKELGVQ